MECIVPLLCYGLDLLEPAVASIPGLVVFDIGDCAVGGGLELDWIVALAGVPAACRSLKPLRSPIHVSSG